MTNKKKSQASLASKAEGDSTGSVSPSFSPTPTQTQPKAEGSSSFANSPRAKQPPPEPSTSALIISRNKYETFYTLRVVFCCLLLCFLSVYLAYGNGHG